jgi:phage shock protein PspC (stress-responsive transcriptional regulator)
METAIKSTHRNTSHSEKRQVSAFWDSMEFSRFGIIAILVVFIGCTGGIAASFGAGDSLIKLAMIAFPSIISLALILAVAPMRVIFYVSLIAVLMDILTFIF